MNTQHRDGRLIGSLFILGAIAMIVGLQLHPPESKDMAVWMGLVAEHAGA